MKNQNLAIITAFALNLAGADSLSLAVSVELADGTTGTINCENLPAQELNNRIAGLLKVAGVLSTDKLVDVEVRVQVQDGHLCLGHRLQARWWQSATLKLAA
ncbi:MAG: hypothetical protein IPM93_30815 [Candidatus Obscuribacter sp.]|nr:hypothetical protein [Candidatus Obscuribacter sp.]